MYCLSSEFNLGITKAALKEVHCHEGKYPWRDLSDKNPGVTRKRSWDELESHVVRRRSTYFCPSFPCRCIMRAGPAAPATLQGHHGHHKKSTAQVLSWSRMEACSSVEGLVCRYRRIAQPLCACTCEKNIKNRSCPASPARNNGTMLSTLEDFKVRR
jgi:hypothetical protein